MQHRMPPPIPESDQRLLELEFKGVTDTELNVQGPPGAAHVPCGYGMLFVLNDEGFPSIGKFLKLA